MADNDEKERSPVLEDEKQWKESDAADDALIASVIRQDPSQSQNLIFSDDHVIDQSDKLPEAQDFEDFSDDDLPDEYPSGGNSGDIPGLTDDGGTSNDTDDLFGEGRESSPLDTSMGGVRSSPQAHPERIIAGEPETDLRLLNFEHDNSFQFGSNQDPLIPPPVETSLDVVKAQWPGFEPGVVMAWNDLMRPKKGAWLGEKKSAKPPRPLVPTKLGLELEADQEKLFRIPGTAVPTYWQKLHEAKARGLASCEEPDLIEQADLEIFDLAADSESGKVGGHTMMDFITICDDWDSVIDLANPKSTNGVQPGSGTRKAKDAADEDEDWDEMFAEELAPAAKRRKTEAPQGLPQISRFDAPNFDNFEEVTKKLGKRILLDMNDPYLLIDDPETERAAKQPKRQHKMVRMANGKLGRDMSQRFSFGNDESYEALKEVNQNRVRIPLANPKVQHSIPAKKLLWPYYKVSMPATDPHSYHRPQMHTRRQAFTTVKFSKGHSVPKKDVKGKKVKDVFLVSKDISLNDNSTAVLFEYSEEIPAVLSNFGMGARVLNYFRRAKGEESKGAKQEIGESRILLPEDRSPLSIFGPIKPNELVPTLHTQMYRAPIFKHDPRGTDFILGRSTSNASGFQWYLRDIDHLFVVGQNYPLMEVPSGSSRRVTNIARNRVRMIAYRMIRRNGELLLQDIGPHLSGSTDIQNRQKLKEFLRFNKETKRWGLKDGELLLDEAGVRSLVKPEDVCAMEAYQVGAHEAELGGWDPASAKKGTVDDDDGGGKKNMTLAEALAPWHTTKNFIDAASGRAMVALHGPGDPTGKGLGMSFIKISMKGGFVESIQGPAATAADQIERSKIYNGHSYNVRDQEELYKDAIEKIWYAQKENLSNTTVHDDDDVLLQEDEDDRFNVHCASESATQIGGDQQSQVSRPSMLIGDQERRKLKIIRRIRGDDGQTETQTEIVHDPVVISQYLRQRQSGAASVDIYKVKADLVTDDNRDEIFKALNREQMRLERNQERRLKREKQKQLAQKGKAGAGGTAEDGSPEPSIEKGTGTTRKCANCGLVGHIKTNKKLCPKLNGTWKEDATNGGAAAINVPVAASFLSSG